MPPYLAGGAASYSSWVHAHAHVHVHVHVHVQHVRALALQAGRTCPRPAAAATRRATSPAAVSNRHTCHTSYTASTLWLLLAYLPGRIEEGTMVTRDP